MSFSTLYEAANLILRDFRLPLEKNRDFAEFPDTRRKPAVRGDYLSRPWFGMMVGDDFDEQTNLSRDLIDDN